MMAVIVQLVTLSIRILVDVFLKTIVNLVTRKAITKVPNIL
jgi:hypothetical protein